jgi:uncharacterized delta-60 repeat protein
MWSRRSACASFEKLEHRTLFDGQIDTAWGSNGVLTADNVFDMEADSKGGLVLLEAGLAYQLVKTDGMMGTGGIINQNYYLESALGIQPDGRFVVAGAYGVRQYSAAGTFIRQFTGGHFANVTSPEVRFFDVAALPNGEVLVTGFMGNNLLGVEEAQIDYAGTERYSAEGAYLGEFNGGGRGELIPLSDGRFLFAGVGSVSRGLSDGRLDPSFNNNMPIQYGGDIYHQFARMNSVAVDGYGRIYAYSIVTNQIGQWAGYLVVRLTPDGQIDTTYGNNGFADPGYVPAGAYSTADDGSFGDKRMMIARDGSAYVAGTVRVGTNDYVALTRLKPDGTIDTTFGTNGVSRPSNINPGAVRDVALLPDGDVVVLSSANQMIRFQAAPPPADMAPEVTLQNGVLTILGTPAADRIIIQSTNIFGVMVTANGQQHVFDELEVRSISLSGGDGKDYIDASALAALPPIAGTDFPVTLDGGNGDDIILGHQGRDRITGAAGNDRIVGGAGDDWLSGNSQKDRIDGGDGDDSIFGNGGGDRLEGSAGDDTLLGGDQPDGIAGGAGNDSVLGEGGHDRLSGDAGQDFISGGGGNDTFYSRDHEIDHLVGGVAAFDQAQVDDDDLLAGIEQLLA